MKKLNPYINFNGNAKQAMSFYADIFGGKLTMSTFKEGGAQTDPDQDHKIMHATLVADNAITIMASDTPNGSKHEHGPCTHISISLSGDNEAELQGFWDELAVGAQIDQPLTKATWGDMFGMLTDKFGIRWFVNITGKKS